MNEPAPKNIQIKINEKEISIPLNTTLFHLKSQFNPDADLIIYNGFPVTSDSPLKQGDEIVFIQKGKIPSPEEFECLMTARHTPGIHRKIKSLLWGSLDWEVLDQPLPLH